MPNVLAGYIKKNERAIILEHNEYNIDITAEWPGTATLLVGFHEEMGDFN